MTNRLRIAVSACIFGPDPSRTTFNGRPLLYLEQSMSDWLMAYGALPYMVPFASGRRPSEVDLDDLMGPLDGLVLQGGVDMSPRSYGEEPLRPEWSGDKLRDEYEIGLVRAAMKQNKPVLGICRGHQVVNVALGGTLYQDINTQIPGTLVHRNADIYEKNRHAVDLTPGSELASWFGTTRMMINSVHHQAVKDVAPGLVVDARSSEDDVIEAIRLPIDSSDDPWVVGVQWHPEFQDPSDTTLAPTKPILDAFFEAIRVRRPLVP